MGEPGTPAGASAESGAERASIEAEAFGIIDRVLRGELNLGRPARLEEELAADLQLDSVGVLTLVVELENRFRVTLREEDAAEVRTVRDLAALVAGRVLEASEAADTDTDTDTDAAARVKRP